MAPFLAIMLGVAIFLVLRQTSPQTETIPAVPEPLAPHYGYEILNTYPHDPTCYTQGLLFDGGFIYESCGTYGNSSLRRVNPENGVVLQMFGLDADYFAEGLTLLNDKLYQLTWRENTGFIYDPQSLETLGTFHYQTQGWGLTTDGSALILSDGSNTLYWLDPATMQILRQVNVTFQQQPIERLNELEYINGRIFANVYLTETIAVINPADGIVLSLIDLSNLRPEKNRQVQGEVLNGIAYDALAGKLYVTGKNWSSLYEIRLLPQFEPTTTTQQ